MNRLVGGNRQGTGADDAVMGSASSCIAMVSLNAPFAVISLSAVLAGKALARHGIALIRVAMTVARLTRSQIRAIFHAVVSVSAFLVSGRAKVSLEIHWPPCLAYLA